MAAGAAPRRAAFEILRAVRSDTTFEEALDAAVASLSSKDAGLAHELAAGVLRHRVRLDRALQPLVNTPWHDVDADVQDLLRLGAYQVLHLDRVPAYAAVQATVEVSKIHNRRASGLVNAVLRRLTDAPVDPPPADLADRFSHPAWLVQRWVDQFGERRAEALLQWNNRRPTLTIRPARWSLDELAKAVSATHTSATRAGDVLQIPEAGPVSRLPGYREGGFFVQDAGQAALIDFADIPTGTIVWDPCAAPGGKTLALAPTHHVVASDRVKTRLDVLAENLTRLRYDVPRFVGDARTPPLPAGSVDAVILDAPCSGTGTLQRHPDARWRLTPERIRRATQLQSAILDAVAPIVRPGGLLVYLTCSLEAEENQLQVDTFLHAHSEFERDGDDMFIYPPERHSDGGYGARLRRRA